MPKRLSEDELHDPDLLRAFQASGDLYNKSRCVYPADTDDDPPRTDRKRPRQRHRFPVVVLEGGVGKTFIQPNLRRKPLRIRLPDEYIDQTIGSNTAGAPIVEADDDRSVAADPFQCTDGRIEHVDDHRIERWEIYSCGEIIRLEQRLPSVPHHPAHRCCAQTCTAEGLGNIGIVVHNQGRIHRRKAAQAIEHPLGAQNMTRADRLASIGSIEDLQRGSVTTGHTIIHRTIRVYLSRPSSFRGRAMRFHGCGYLVIMTELSVYVHIPYCAKRCTYCDFATFTHREHEEEAYVAAVCQQIDECPYSTRPVRSVYIGGGTPTHVTPAGLCSILNRLRDRFPFTPDAEISLEANPASADGPRFEQLLAAGYNRISFGVQSFNDDSLRLLGRLHSSNDAIDAIRTARAAGFTNISLDMMFALPRQTIRAWTADLDTALDTGVDHISAYSLILEAGTPLTARVRRGLLPEPDDAAAAEMMMQAHRILSGHGFDHYEIANYARPGFRCRHNIVYWTNGEYLGFGSAAASYVNGCRATAVRDSSEFIRRVQLGQSVIAAEERLPRAEAVAETIMLGIRLLDGVDIEHIEERYAVRLTDVLAPVTTRLQQRGLLRVSGPQIQLTEQGMLLADTVAAELMACVEISLRADSNR